MSKATQKKAETFQRRATSLIAQIEALIEKMPDKGNSSSESQKVCLSQALNQFEHTVNGVEASDFEKEKD